MDLLFANEKRGVSIEAMVLETASKFVGTDEGVSSPRYIGETLGKLAYMGLVMIKARSFMLTASGRTEWKRHTCSPDKDDQNTARPSSSTQTSRRPTATWTKANETRAETAEFSLMEAILMDELQSTLYTHETHGICIEGFRKTMEIALDKRLYGMKLRHSKTFDEDADPFDDYPAGIERGRVFETAVEDLMERGLVEIGEYSGHYVFSQKGERAWQLWQATHD
jgi:hypothetical protein